MARSFSDQVSDWCRESERRMERAFQVSVGDLATEMARTKPNGGTVPVDTGNLARSLLGSKSAPPKTGDADEEYAGFDPGAFAAGLKLGQTAYLGYQAAYARRMNYGYVGTDSLGRTYDQKGNYFVERAVTMWPFIVAAAAAKVRGT